MPSIRDLNISSVSLGASPGGDSASLASGRRLASPILALLAAVAMAVVALIAVQPTFAQDMTIEYAENGKDPVSVFTGRGPEGAPIAWDIVEDNSDPDGAGDLTATENADADHFTIDKDGMLNFSSPPDFENPSGEGGTTSNNYKVVVVACDVPLETNACPASGNAGYYPVTVKVTKVDEDGKVTWTVDPDGADDATLSANDPTATPPQMPIMQFQVGATLVASATDGDVSGVAKAVSNPIWRWYRGSTPIDGQTTNTYNVTTADVGSHIRAMVTYVVAGNVDQETASLTSDYPVLAARLGDSELEFDPATVSRKVAEGDKGMNVGAPVTATGNHGAVNYVLGGTDVAKFKIDAKTGQITTDVKTDREAGNGADDNCAAANACIVTVTATDASGEAATAATVNIEITNVDEKPTFTSGPMAITIPENSEMLFGDAAADYSIADAAGVTYTATDPETSNVTLSLMGDDGAKFELQALATPVSGSGILAFKEEPDYEMPGDADGDNVYEVTVRASDGTLIEDRMVKVTVIDADDPPEITEVSSPIEYAENGKDPGGHLHGHRPGWDTVTWPTTLTGVDSADFTIDEDDGILKFAASPDFENPADDDTNNTYAVTVTASSTGASGTAQTDTFDLSVKVTKVNEPGKVTWTVDPDGADDSTLSANDPTATPPQMPIMQFQVDATLVATASDGDITNPTQTFAADVTDEVTGVTWRWYRGSTLITGQTTNSYTVTTADVGSRIRATVRYNVAGNTTQETASLTSDYPVLAARLGDSELEFNPATVSRKVAEGDKGMMVGAPVTATGNHGAVNYVLGGTDVARFKIDRKTGQITTDADLNHEAANGADDNCAAANACIVTVTATDASGEAATAATVNIEITDVDEKPEFVTDGTGPPAAISPKTITRDEGMTALADTDPPVTYGATDPEDLSVNLTLMGSDAAKFGLDSGGVLSFNAKPDYEMPGDADGDNVYEVTVRASTAH